jgi:ArsR family transcriptional regulator
MPVDLDLAPKTKRPAGDPCCEPIVYPDVERAQADRTAAIAKALGDPVRLQLSDGLVGSEWQGLWAYYYVIPDALELSGWLGSAQAG